MLTVHGQQHLFLTHEQMFLWKCQSFWDKKCLKLRVSWTPNFRIHAQYSNHLRDIFVVKLTFRMLTVPVQVSKDLRQKMSWPGDVSFNGRKGFLYVANTMSTDDLVMKKARTSAAMILTQFTYPVPNHDLIQCYSQPHTQKQQQNKNFSDFAIKSPNLPMKKKIKNVICKLLAILFQPQSIKIMAIFLSNHPVEKLIDGLT